VTAAKKSFASESRDGPVHRHSSPERIVMPKKKSSSKSRTSNVYKATKRATRKSTTAAQPTTPATTSAKPSTLATVPASTNIPVKETSPASAPPAKPAPAPTMTATATTTATKKLSALDAAAKILGESGTPMSVKQLIETMAERGLWTSPGGKTPGATLYSSILREITTKGSAARFQKTDRGRFSSRG